MYVEEKQNKTYVTPSVYTLSAEETNQPNTELQNLILEGGLTPDANDLTQVKTAVINMITNMVLAKIGVANGIATLDANALIPASELPIIDGGNSLG